MPAACAASRSSQAASRGVGAAAAARATRRAKGTACPCRCCTTKYDHADLCVQGDAAHQPHSSLRPMQRARLPLPSHPYPLQPAGHMQAAGLGEDRSRLRHRRRAGIVWHAPSQPLHELMAFETIVHMLCPRKFHSRCEAKPVGNEGTSSGRVEL